MATILNESDFWSSLGSGAGKGLASGLQAGLGKLSEHKLNTVLSRLGVPLEGKQGADDAELNSLSTLLGNKDLARTLIGLPEKARYNALGNLIDSGYLNKQAQQPQPGQPIQAPTPQGSPVRAQAPEPMRQMQTPKTAEDLLSQRLLPETLRRAMAKTPIQQPQTASLLPAVAQQNIAPQQQVPAPSEVTQRQPTNLAEILFKPRETPQMKQAERQHAERMEFAREKENRREFESSLKETKNIRERAQENVQRADKDIEAYENLERLNNSDALIGGKGRQILEKLGLENFFINPASELAVKELARLEQGAAQAFQSKRGVTNFEIERYANSLGTLRNSKEGRKGIFKIKLAERKAERAVSKEVNKIAREARENKQPIPFDIEAQAYARSEPERQKYALSAQQAFDQAIRASTKAGNGFRVVGTTNQLPDASSVPNKIFKTPEDSYVKSIDGQWQAYTPRGVQ